MVLIICPRSRGYIMSGETLLAHACIPVCHMSPYEKCKHSDFQNQILPTKHVEQLRESQFPLGSGSSSSLISVNSLPVFGILDYKSCQSTAKYNSSCTSIHEQPPIETEECDRLSSGRSKGMPIACEDICKERKKKVKGKSRKPKKLKSKKKSNSQNKPILSLVAQKPDYTSIFDFKVPPSSLNSLSAQCSTIQIHEHPELKSKVPTRQAVVNVRYGQHSQTNLIQESDIRKPSYSLPVPTFNAMRSSLAQAEKVYLQKVTKVFLSERQSGSILEEGKAIPCAPPVTPTPDHLKLYEYVPSLNDIRAQRAFRQRLEAMERKELQKEEKKKEQKVKFNKELMKNRVMEIRKRQRLEIYALNKIMTELEHRKFTEFSQYMGLN